ncbi:glycosyl hydrolases family 31-domain-containing protein [Obelidium mucronatum]|nr:glycosyl hydrolases family 31-domain-containing protein [Obelidium mucronatum]
MKTLLALLLVALGTAAVKRHDFKTCAQSGFCTRQRAFGHVSEHQETPPETYSLLASTLAVAGDQRSVEATVRADASLALFALRIDAAAGGGLRVRLREAGGDAFDLGGVAGLALAAEANATAAAFARVGAGGRVLELANQNTLHIDAAPFALRVVARSGAVLAVFNERGFLNCEHRRAKVDESAASTGEAAADADLSEDEKRLKQWKEDLNKDKWEESFGGKTDSKPKGPTSMGFDLSFPGFSHVYGLPQHASSYSLKTTRGPNAPYSDPYRLYNFDVFEYELDNPMALYGSVPFLLAHSAQQGSVGALWVNSAEMWVDVEKRASGGFSKKNNEANLNKQESRDSTTKPSTSTHWMAESGIIDLFLFFGPDPASIADQLTLYTGRSALPQHFAIGYHQSRWNYLDEQDVDDVDNKFDQNDIPYDVLWLDIEHTNGKRYFTWDKVKFPNPTEMQEALGVKGRKMVTIIDPHLKQDDGYSVSKQAKDLGLLVKNKDNGDFDGWCWPGTSYWIDYLNPDGRKFWAEQFKYSNYEGSTKFLYTWNDMNEPSVFSGPEITMPKDNLHYGGVEHRDVHNIYGALQHRATAEGHKLRSDNTDRPFVLSRAFFIGTQRYGAIWTGDNTAQWEHLEASIPMLLTIGVSGITFCGADVGGFFGNPDTELLIRWYQAAAYQPFFRAHAHIDTKRREPWLFGEPYTSLIRESVRRRYRILPYLYTLFWEANQNGSPIMRSLMHEFPTDEKTFDIENAFMLGSALLVHPVVKKDTSSVDVYLPPSAKWYDYDTFAVMKTGLINVPTPLEKVPTYLRAGTILPRRDRIRRAANLSLRDPYTLIIALDDQGSAKGTLYVDDGHSYEHETDGKYIIVDFVYEKGVLKASSKRRIEESKEVGLTRRVVESLGSRVERLVLVGGKVKSVTVEKEGEEKRRLEFRSEGNVVIVKDPKVVVGDEWKIVVA